MPPKVIYRPDQPYPDRARRRKEEGPVYLKARVLVAGSAGNVEILSSPGSRDLEQAAIEWVKKWKFAPATLDGRPVEHEFVIRINFRL